MDNSAENNLVVIKKVWDYRYLPIAILIGIAFLILFLLLIITFGMGLINSLISLSILIVFYAIIVFSLLEFDVINKTHETIRTVDRPVIKEVIKRVVRTVRVPVIRRVIKFVKPKVKRLVIPKYKYLGSSETKTYHRHGCRLSKLIKNKYKVSNNSEAYFKKHRYHGCKVCIKKTKKI